MTKNGTFGLVIEKATDSPSNNRTFTDPALYSTRLHYHVRTAVSPQSHPVHRRRYLWNTKEKLERDPMGWRLVPKPKLVDDDIPVAVLRLDWTDMDKDIASDKREINPFDLLERRPGVPASDIYFRRTDDEKKESSLSLTAGECLGYNSGKIDTDAGSSLYLALSALRRMRLPASCWYHDLPAINIDLDTGEEYPFCEPKHQLREGARRPHIVEALESLAKIAQNIVPGRVASGYCTVWDWKVMWGEYKEWKVRFPDKTQREGKEALRDFMEQMRKHEGDKVLMWHFMQWRGSVLLWTCRVLPV